LGNSACNYFSFVGNGSANISAGVYSFVGNGGGFEDDGGTPLFLG
jgi:hypothetical protein